MMPSILASCRATTSPSAAYGFDTLSFELSAGGNVQFDQIEKLSILGSSGDDLFNVFNVQLAFDGRGGFDRISGGSFDDTLDGGADTDLLSGGGGSDTLRGGADDDTLAGDDGADFLQGDAEMTR